MLPEIVNSESDYLCEFLDKFLCNMHLEGAYAFLCDH